MSVREQEKTDDWHIHLRGEIRNLGPVVQRGFLQVAMPKRELHQLLRYRKERSGRLQLAEWIASSTIHYLQEFMQIEFGIIFLAEGLWQVLIILVKWGTAPPIQNFWIIWPDI